MPDFLQKMKNKCKHLIPHNQPQSHEASVSENAQQWGPPSDAQGMNSSSFLSSYDEIKELKKLIAKNLNLMAFVDSDIPKEGQDAEDLILLTSYFLLKSKKDVNDVSIKEVEENKTILAVLNAIVKIPQDERQDVVSHALHLVPDNSLGPQAVAILSPLFQALQRIPQRDRREMIALVLPLVKQANIQNTTSISSLLQATFKISSKEERREVLQQARDLLSIARGGRTAGRLVDTLAAVPKEEREEIVSLIKASPLPLIKNEFLISPIVKALYNVSPSQGRADVLRQVSNLIGDRSLAPEEVEEIFDAIANLPKYERPGLIALAKPLFLHIQKAADIVYILEHIEYLPDEEIDGNLSQVLSLFAAFPFTDKFSLTPLLDVFDAIRGVPQKEREHVLSVIGSQFSQMEIRRFHTIIKTLSYFPPDLRNPVLSNLLQEKNIAVEANDNIIQQWFSTNPTAREQILDYLEDTLDECCSPEEGRKMAKNIQEIFSDIGPMYVKTKGGNKKQLTLLQEELANHPILWLAKQKSTETGQNHSNRSKHVRSVAKQSSPPTTRDEYLAKKYIKKWYKAMRYKTMERASPEAYKALGRGTFWEDPTFDQNSMILLSQKTTQTLEMGMRIIADCLDIPVENGHRFVEEFSKLDFSLIHWTRLGEKYPFIKSLQELTKQGSLVEHNTEADDIKELSNQSFAFFKMQLNPHTYNLPFHRSRFGTYGYVFPLKDSGLTKIGHLYALDPIYAEEDRVYSKMFKDTTVGSKIPKEIRTLRKVIGSSNFSYPSHPESELEDRAPQKKMFYGQDILKGLALHILLESFNLSPEITKTLLSSSLEGPEMIKLLDVLLTRVVKIQALLPRHVATRYFSSFGHKDEL